MTSASLALPAIVYCSASCAVISGWSLYAHDMNRIGRAPYLWTIVASFFTVSRNAPSSCGWIGHWLQSIMITASNWRPAD